MKNFFILLLKINGILLLLLSVAILVQIWTDAISNKELFGKIVGSYCIIIVNFFVLSSVNKHIEKLDTKDK